MSQQTNSIPEQMASFFNTRAEGYENHMRECMDDLEAYYATVASPLPETTASIRILDLGCGTGRELEDIFRKAPNAIIMGIDMSEHMLALLKKTYAQYADQLHLVCDSYVNATFAHNEYDYVVSVMTMHHLLEDVKRELYQRIRTVLKDKGLYLEGDYVVNEELEQLYMREYHEEMQSLDEHELYHIDIPFTIQRQERLLREAGFTDVNTIYHVGDGAIFVARK